MFHPSACALFTFESLKTDLKNILWLCRGRARTDANRAAQLSSRDPILQNTKTKCTSRRREWRQSVIDMGHRGFSFQKKKQCTIRLWSVPVNQMLQTWMLLVSTQYVWISKIIRLSLIGNVKRSGRCCTLEKVVESWHGIREDILRSARGEKKM